MYWSKLAPVRGHDEDVVVDEDSNDQDYKSNRLKMEELNFFFLKKKENLPPQIQSGHVPYRGTAQMALGTQCR